MEEDQQQKTLLPDDAKTLVSIEQPDIDHSNEWSVCCSNTNRFALKYLIQVSMGSAVMIFAMCQIALGDDQEDKSIYYSLLSGTLGYFLPHPSMNE